MEMQMSVTVCNSLEIVAVFAYGILLSRAWKEILACLYLFICRETR